MQNVQLNSAIDHSNQNAQLSERTGLSTSIAIETNWVVITGAPSSGKTTLINEFSRIGLPIVSEAARACITERMATGLTIEQVRADRFSLQSAVLEKSIREATLSDPDETVFFDRGIPDSIVFWNLNGLSDESPRLASERFRYRHIFLLESVGFHDDGLRFESGELALQISNSLESVYTELGYTPIRVPKMPVSERIHFILDYLEQSKLSSLINRRSLLL